MKSVKFINVMKGFEKIIFTHKLSLIDYCGAVMLLRLSKAYTGGDKRSKAVSLIDVNNILRTCIEEHGSCSMETVANFIIKSYNWQSSSRLSVEDKTLGVEEIRVIDKIADSIDSYVLAGTPMTLSQIDNTIENYKKEMSL